MSSRIEIPFIKVNQWLSDWSNVPFDEKGNHENRAKPLPYFFMFTIKAGLLKKLSKVYPRRADSKRDIEIGIQRKHDPDRSKEITKYIKNGYPLSELAKGDKIPEDLKNLQMPGWLPTAIVANILKKGTKRGEIQIDEKDLIKIEEKNSSKLILPAEAASKDWNPKVPPIEIIDGQHRLWAFDPKDPIADEFELPVVAFFDLDITWQAYLFYTINVKPKKINRSLAYDLYPLLRVQEWLEKSPDTAFVYKETRAQEIVEVLWSYDKSPWKNKINMLGDVRSYSNITQASFIRNLIASFIKTNTTKGLGGLFGSKLNDDYGLPLSWNRTQQAAFIIWIWQVMYDSICDCKLPWANALRKDKTQVKLFEDIAKQDLAFASKFSLITSDQGVRGFLHVINDMVYIRSSDLDLRNIKWSIDGEEIKEERIDQKDVTKTIGDFKKGEMVDYITKICDELVKFDWRTSSQPDLDEKQRRAQMVFKGSSGYKELRNQLLQLLMSSSNKKIKETSALVFDELGYAK